MCLAVRRMVSGKWFHLRFPVSVGVAVRRRREKAVVAEKAGKWRKCCKKRPLITVSGRLEQAAFLGKALFIRMNFTGIPGKNPLCPDGRLSSFF